MRIYAILSLAILLLGLAPGSMLAQPAPSPATVSASQQLDFTSAVNGKTYRIQVALPYAPPPKGGFRTLYVLDGGAYFASFADAARLRNALGQELQPAIIVAISYPGPIAVAINRRLYDLTPTAPPGAEREARAKQSQGGTPNEYAGADTFLKIIETEIKPKIAAAMGPG